MTATATPTIAVHDLRVGMYVHLDLGWMSHPFPLSSFRIDREQDIDTLRGLGLTHVRWSPHKSRINEANADLPRPSTLAGTQLAAASADADEPLARSPGGETPEAAERRRRREQLAAQRAASLHCERQYTEAARELRRTVELVAGDPAAARARTEALSRALVDKMLDQRETCIRLLSEAAGERATAHALNVTVVSLLLGKLLGLDAAAMGELGAGALLHDIGKIELPDRVRHLDEAFSAAETRLYREHVAHGVAHARRMGLAPGALLVVAQHHEMADGSGFPQKLAAERMSLAARIVALVNRYDNLCNPPQPGRAMTPHEALSTLFAQGRTRFDATVLSSFIRMMGVYPPGSVVQLTDDRWALVMTVNSARPLKPRVLVHDRRTPRDEALYVDLERDSTLGIRRSVRASQLPVDALQYLAPAARVAYFFEPSAAADAAPRAEDGS